MTDISTYRQQIGSFYNIRNHMKNKSKSEFYFNNTYRTIYSLSLCIILNIFLLLALSCSHYLDSAGQYIYETFPLNTIMNIYFNWNLYMRIINGNGRDTITIAHWNGGGSYLCLSDRGKEKMENIKLLLSDHKFDILGISEANLSSKVNSSLYHIEGYNTITAQGDPSRIIVFIKNNLTYKIRNDLNNNLEAIWFEVGKFKSKWLFCQYYRQHKIIGCNGSETINEQHSRFDNFLDTISSINHTNSLILGDFNINLDDSDNSFNHRNLEFKDKLLNTLPLLGFVQMLRECTRFCSNSVPTLIDHI